MTSKTLTDLPTDLIGEIALFGNLEDVLCFRLICKDLCWNVDQSVVWNEMCPFYQCVPEPGELRFETYLRHCKKFSKILKANGCITWWTKEPFQDDLIDGTWIKTSVGEFRFEMVRNPRQLEWWSRRKSCSDTTGVLEIMKKARDERFDNLDKSGWWKRLGFSKKLEVSEKQRARLKDSMEAYFDFRRDHYEHPLLISAKWTINNHEMLFSDMDETKELYRPPPEWCGRKWILWMSRDRQGKIILYCYVCAAHEGTGQCWLRIKRRHNEGFESLLKWKEDDDDDEVMGEGKAKKTSWSDKCIIL